MLKVDLQPGKEIGIEYIGTIKRETQVTLRRVEGTARNTGQLYNFVSMQMESAGSTLGNISISELLLESEFGIQAETLPAGADFSFWMPNETMFKLEVGTGSNFNTQVRFAGLVNSK